MTEPAAGSRLLDALRRRRVDCTPVWFMRQAGRALPGYRRIRERYRLLDICADADLTTQVTLEPVHALGVDGAILFADITTPLIAVGLEIDIVEGVGPVVERPIRTSEDIARIRALDPQADMPAQLQAIGMLRSELSGSGVALIGFAGAPFTVASYLIEGRATRDFLNTKRLMHEAPEVWHQLLDRLTGLLENYLKAQVAAGVQVVQLFDSWAGALAPRDYRRFALPYSRRLLTSPALDDTPTIHFSTGTAGFLELIREAGGTAVSVDWRISLDSAWARVGQDVALQGNLDPLVLLAPFPTVRSEAMAILDAARGRPGHIFNLGHGVHPATPVETLRQLVDAVHERPLPVAA